MNRILIIGCGLIGSSVLRAVNKKKVAKKIFILEKSKTEETKLVLKDELSAALVLPKEQKTNKIALLMPIRLN